MVAAASERNFSTFGYMHSKLRNSLSEILVEKLVYIKTNNSHLQTGQAKSWIDATDIHNNDPPLDEIDNDQQQHDQTDHKYLLEQEGSQ